MRKASIDKKQVSKN